MKVSPSRVSTTKFKPRKLESNSHPQPNGAPAIDPFLSEAVDQFSSRTFQPPVASVTSGSPGAGDLFFRRPLQHRLNRLAAEAGEVSVPGSGQRRTSMSTSCPRILPARPVPTSSRGGHLHLVRIFPQFPLCRIARFVSRYMLIFLPVFDRPGRYGLQYLSTLTVVQPR